MRAGRGWVLLSTGGVEEAHASRTAKDRKPFSLSALQERQRGSNREAIPSIWPVSDKRGGAARPPADSPPGDRRKRSLGTVGRGACYSGRKRWTLRREKTPGPIYVLSRERAWCKKMEAPPSRCFKQGRIHCDDCFFKLTCSVLISAPPTKLCAFPTRDSFPPPNIQFSLHPALPNSTT